MASWYYDRLSGNDTTGTGAAGNPWKTVGKVLTAANSGAGPAPGDVIYGAHSGKETINMGSFSGVTHEDWGGFAVDSDGASCHGATFVTAASWAVSSGNTYSVSIGAGLTVANVCDRWASRVDASGRHYGWLALGAAPVGGALASAGLWYYDSAGGLLYVWLVGNTDPRTLTGEDRVAYVADHSAPLLIAQAASSIWNGRGVGGVSAITPNVQVGQFRHVSSTSGAVYCAAINGQGTTFRNFRLDGGEDHALIIGSSGGASSECTVENVDSWGMGKTASGTSFTAYSGASGNVDGSVFRSCTAHAYTLLDSSGNPLLFNASWAAQATPLSLQGFYHHTDGAGGRVVSDVLIDRCTVRGYGTSAATHNRVTPFNGGNTAALAGGSAYLDYTQYPVRHNRCKAYGCSLNIMSGNLAFRESFIDLTKASYNTSDSFVGSVNGGATVLYESCVILVNLQRGSSNRSLFHLYAGARLVLHHCTVIDISTGGNWYHDMFSVASAATYNGSNAGFSLELRGNLFAFANPNTPATVENRFIIGDSGAPAGNYTISGNCYHNVSATQMSDDTSRNTWAEWLAGVDTTGTNVDPLLASITSIADGTAGTLSETSPLRHHAYKRVFQAGQGRPSSRMGYADTRYDGTIGAYQYGVTTTLRAHAAGEIVDEEVDEEE